MAELDVLNISRQLFNLWNNTDLLYCHWKSNEHLLAGLNGETDLDVLLAKKDKEKGREILYSLDFLPCRSQFGSRYPDVEDWIGFDRETGCLIHLHLHFQLITGHKGLKEYNLPWTEKMLQCRIKDESTGVYIADPNLELITLYSRIALKVPFKDLFKLRRGNFQIEKAYFTEIRYLKTKVNWEVVASHVHNYYGKYATEVLSIIKAPTLSCELLSRLRQIVEYHFLVYNRLGHANRFLELYFKYVIKIRKIFRTQFKCCIINRKTPLLGKGLQIAFLGQDGAGKTTITRDIREWWSWKMDVQYIYLGSGDNYFSWRKTLQKVIPNSSPFKLFRAWLQLSKYIQLAKDVLSMIRFGEKFAEKGGLVIYDRYPQIQYLGINDGPKIRKNIIGRMPKVLRFLLIRYANKEEHILKEACLHHPDIVFKLIIPPEESVKRKPENKIETMIFKHNLIKSLDFNGSNVYIIDATVPYEQEILEIKQIIWDHIQK